MPHSLFTIHQNAEAPYTVSLVCTSTVFDLSLVTSATIQVFRSDETPSIWTTALVNQSASSVTLVHSLVTGDVPDVEDLRLHGELIVPSGLLVSAAETLKVHARPNQV